MTGMTGMTGMGRDVGDGHPGHPGHVQCDHTHSPLENTGINVSLSVFAVQSTAHAVREREQTQLSKLLQTRSENINSYLSSGFEQFAIATTIHSFVEKERNFVEK